MENSDDDSVSSEALASDQCSAGVEIFKKSYSKQCTTREAIVGATGSALPKNLPFEDSQKETNQHALDLLKGSRRPIFLCSACIYDQMKSPATSSCKICEELYCESCSKGHKRLKATRNHALSYHAGLSERCVCEPCGYVGEVNVVAIYFCADCDEAMCQNCHTVHAKQKETRHHSLIYSASSDQLFKQNRTPSKPEMYYLHRSSEPSVDCFATQTLDSTEINNKLLDITATKANSTRTTQSVSSLIDSKATNVAPIQASENEHADKSDASNLKSPGKPYVVGSVQVDSICLAWEAPKKMSQEYSYQLRFKEVYTNSKWYFHPQLAAKSTLTLSNLKSNTQYIFQVRMVCDESEGPYSEISDVVQTIRSAAHQLLDFVYDVSVPNISIPLKKIPLYENVKARNVKGKTRKLLVGDVLKSNAKEKTIMLVGSTGTGKSTLVDGMVNYSLGVNWNDPYRLTLVDREDDERNTGCNQDVSQTQWITCYVINPIQGSRLDYTLKIIDTPGFGDTRGIERDKEIMEQIRTLFSSKDESGIDFIDAVCFVVKAPDARLTPTQIHIFNAIMSLFGQDIKNNFCILVTFADGGPPPVLSALREADLPYEQFFPFNNAWLFAQNSGENVSSSSLMFWDIGCSSFQKFFDKLALLETKSLRQTRNVLVQRQVIELTMENLLPKLDAGLNKVEEMRRAVDEKMTRKKVVERMYEELNEIEDDIMELMEKINECNNILRQVALRPVPLSVVEHIDLLMKSEKLQKSPGFQARIASLQQCRKRADFTNTTKTITVEVKMPQKSAKRRNRNGELGFLQSVFDYFQK